MKQVFPLQRAYQLANQHRATIINSLCYIWLIPLIYFVTIHLFECTGSRSTQHPKWAILGAFLVCDVVQTFSLQYEMPGGLWD